MEEKAKCMCNKPIIPTISIPNYICGNCNQLNKETCTLQGLKRQKEDVACSQIFEHYIGETEKGRNGQNIGEKAY